MGRVDQSGVFRIAPAAGPMHVRQGADWAAIRFQVDHDGKRYVARAPNVEGTPCGTGATPEKAVDACRRACGHALKAGARLIDTAPASSSALE